MRRRFLPKEPKWPLSRLMSVRRPIAAWSSTLLVLVVLTVAACGAGDGPRSQPDGDRSALSDRAAQAEEPRAVGLIGVTWVAAGFLDGGSVEPPSGPGHVRFEPNGFVTGTDGCNGFGFAASDEQDDNSTHALRYEVIGNDINFTGSPVSTLIGCSDTEYETRIRHVLRGSVTYEIDGSVLTLTAADGRGVKFTRQN